MSKESGWNLGNTLHSLWQIFHNSTARKEDFIQITGSNLFPFRFCQYRWIEDIKVTEQALKIWPHVNKYVKTLQSERRAATFAFLFLSHLHSTIPQLKLS